MHIAVCDDERVCIEEIRCLLQKYPGVCRIEYYDDPDRLSEAVQSGAVYDLILMDIEWNGRTGNGIH